MTGRMAKHFTKVAPNNNAAMLEWLRYRRDKQGRVFMNQDSSERCPCCGAAFDRQWYANWLGTMPRGCTPLEIAFWECGSKRTKPDGITLSNKCLTRQVKKRDSKLARIASACGIPDPAEACRVILQIVKEKP